MSKIVAVGDIHGDVKKLMDVIDELDGKVDFESTPFVFMGDYVDGGIWTKQVIAKLMAFQEQYPHWVFLKGNHEDMMLDALLEGSKRYGSVNQWWQQGGAETYLSYDPAYQYTYAYYGDVADLVNKIDAAHLTWLADRPTMFESKSFFFVHAGFKPHKRPKMTDPFDRMWIRGEFINSPYNWRKTVVFGHTCFPKVFQDPSGNKIGIDTMHHGHGVLSAVVLDDETGALIDVVESYRT